MRLAVLLALVPAISAAASMPSFPNWSGFFEATAASALPSTWIYQSLGMRSVGPYATDSSGTSLVTTITLMDKDTSYAVFYNNATGSPKATTCVQFTGPLNPSTVDDNVLRLADAVHNGTAVIDDGVTVDVWVGKGTDGKYAAKVMTGVADGMPKYVDNWYNGGRLAARLGTFRDYGPDVSHFAPPSGIACFPQGGGVEKEAAGAGEGLVVPK